MKYFIIKNCRLAGYDNEPTNIIIGNDRIINIKKGVFPPTLDTDEYDAKGAYVLTPLTDINADFDIENSEDYWAVDESLAAGVTTWIATRPTTNIIPSLGKIEEHSKCMPNYSLHLSGETLRQPLTFNKISDLRHTYGITTALSTYFTNQLPTAEHISKMLSVCEREELTMVFELVQNAQATEQQYIGAFEIFVEMVVKYAKTPVIFLNICYEEEFAIISKHRGNKLLFAQLCYSPLKPDNQRLTPWRPDQYCNALRFNTWCFAAISGAKYGKYSATDKEKSLFRRNSLSFLASLEAKNPLTIRELNEFASVRANRLVGLSVMQNPISTGTKANLCIWNPNIERTIELNNTPIKLRGKICAVLVNGRLVYTDFLEKKQHTGKCVYRRIIR